MATPRKKKPVVEAAPEMGPASADLPTPPEAMPLSHSSASLLLDCEQRYVHHKILKTPNDPDYVKSDALAVGSAFHWILENSRHEKPKSITADLAHCAADKDIRLPEEEFALVHAMIISYLRLHLQKMPGFKVLEVETEIKTEMFHGFIDAILEDPEGRWHILDLKTYKTLYRPGLVALPRDAQLALYAGHAPLLAEMHNLDLKRFGGVRWRVVTKSTAKQKASETQAEFVMRLVDKHVNAYDLAISADQLDVAERMELHKLLWETSKELRTRKPTRNYKACFSFFSPCPWFSRCHNVLASAEPGVVITEG
jgi:RecB family exonuclease